MKLRARHSISMVFLIFSMLGTMEAQAASIADLAFMTGCWSGKLIFQGQEMVLQKHYSAVKNNLIFAELEAVLNGQVSWETQVFGQNGSDITFLDIQNGSIHANYTLKQMKMDLRTKTATFEANTEQLQSRVTFSVKNGNSLQVLVDEKADSQPPLSLSMSMNRVSCKDWIKNE